MSDPIHPDELIHRLRLDRRRCFVITARPGEGKTRLAEQMARRYGGRRLDVLATFAADSTLVDTVDTFTPNRCSEFLHSRGTGDLVLVDEMEFLWHSWDDADKRQFLTILKMSDKPGFFGVFLPPDPIVESFHMVDQDGEPRILSVHDLQAIK